MTRPKSDDPKLAVTLRLPTSVLARWQASGDDWRQRMEGALCEGDTGPPVSPKQVLEAAERRVGVDSVRLVPAPKTKAPTAAAIPAARPVPERVSMARAMDDAGIQVGRTTYKPGALLKGPKPTKGKR